jgi:nicotinate-nucleotide adenylyltransferase
LSSSKAQAPSPARIGVFGGTFDPIHLAHLVIAQESLTQLSLDQVLFVPTGQPPHKANRVISPARQREAMVARAIHPDSRFALSTMEIEREGPSYTVETLACLHATWPTSVALFLILGGDMVYDLVNWRDPPGIVRQVAGIVAIQRPGYAFTATALAHLEAQVAGLRARIMPIDAPD